MSINCYQKNNTYGDLKSVVLGSYYTADYFEYVQNPKIRSVLAKIADEINEDLYIFESFLKKQNIKVIRPELPSIENFYQHVEQYQQLPRPPLQPRNNHSVIGKQLYKINQSEPFIDLCLQQYNPSVVDLSQCNEEFFQKSLLLHEKCCYNNTWFKREKYLELAGIDWPDFYEYVQGKQATLRHIQEEIDQFSESLKYHQRDFNFLPGPNIFPIDNGIIIDSNEYCNYKEWAAQHIGDANYISINTGAGHTDGCFTVLGNNTILGISPLIDYAQHFPGYTVVSVPDKNYINYISSFNQMKTAVGGKWWVHGQEKNSDFIDFIEHYCNDWLGFVEETVFDVNVLAVNPETVCVSGVNPDIQKHLAAQGIETVFIPWRHRFFVDGGLHCITLDLYRE